MKKVLHLNYFIIILCLFLYASCYLNNSADSTSIIEKQNETVLWPHEKSDLSPDHSVIFKRLSNGMGYILMPNNEPKDRVSMHLYIRVGSIYEKDNEQGVAHFLEHMLFCGTTNFKPGELIEYFQSIGMQFGPDANASTGFYQTVYDILLPKPDKESIENGLLVMKDFAEGALIPEAEVERERKVILAEKITRDSASYRTFLKTINFELDGAKPAKRLPIGKEESLLKADRTLLKDFYDSWYSPSNITLIIVGNFDIPLCESLIEEKFSDLKEKAPKRPSYDFGDVKHKGTKAFYHYEKEEGYTSVSIEVVEKIKNQSDSFELQKQYLINDIVDQMVQNRIERLIGKPETPFTSASIGSGIYLKNVKFASISAKCSPLKWMKSLTIIENILRQAIDYGFTQSELNRVKKNFLSELDNDVKASPTRDSSKIAREIIASISNDEVFISPLQKKQLFSPAIESLTIQDVNKAFKKLWTPSHRLILVTGNAEINSENKSPLEQILSVYNESLKIKLPKPIEKEIPIFPYLEVPPNNGIITKKEVLDDIGVILVDFENNVRLNLKKTDFKSDEVLLSLSFGNGKSIEPKDKPGLSELCTSVVNESGLKKLSKEELNEALAGKKTHIYFSINESKFMFKGNTSKKELKLAFEILYAYLKDFTLQKDSLKLCLERFKHKYDELSNEVEGAMDLFGERFLSGGDGRFGLPPFDELSKYTIKDINEWIQNYIEKDALEISIVGDFNIDEAVELASTYIGTLPKREKISVNSYRLPIFPKGKSLDISVPSKISKAIIRVAYPTFDIWNIENTRRMAMVGEIFSERLRKEIREKLGASYSPYAYNAPSRAYSGYGVFHVVVTASPKEINIVKENIKKIALNLNSNGITEDELKLSLEPVINSIKDLVRTNKYWLNNVLISSKEHPEQISWSKSILDDYSSITPEEISKFAKIYLNNEKAAFITIKSE
ncbi:MAG: insulinase family protein [Desulfobacterales bacterium]|nr:insulinase family protein [Desulfobacterales bacterium]